MSTAITAPETIDDADDSGTIVGVLDLGHFATDVHRAREWTRERVTEVITVPVIAAREKIDDVVLCVSEAVTNAVEHSRRGLPDDKITVVLIDRRWSIRVEVIDPGNAFGHKPHIPAITPDSADGGRGLAIVDALSIDWGAYADHYGRTVWFEVDF